MRSQSVKPLLFLFVVTLLSVPAFANVYVPNTFTDPVITTLNNATGAINGGATISLRSALMAADNMGVTGGPHTVTLSTGTYNLSKAPKSQIVIGNTPQNITINGNGPANTIINMVNDANRDRFLLINPVGTTNSPVISISGVTFQNGYLTTDFYGGGAIYAGGGTAESLTLTNCAFVNNTTPAGNGGGAAVKIDPRGNLTVNNCTFTNNVSNDADGGAILFLINSGSLGTGYGTLSVTNSTFTGNSVNQPGAGTSNGGALAVAGQGGVTPFNATITNNTFINNTTDGVGGAISANNGPALSILQIHYNRFVGNTAVAGAASNALHFVESSGSVNADNNWWGCNAGPGGAPCDRAGGDVAGGGSLTTSPWLQLRHTGSPSAVLLGGNSTLTADIYGRNAGGPLPNCPGASCLLNGLAPFTVTFNNATRGTLSGAGTQLVNGQATATFTAGVVSASCGAGGADAVVDSQTVNAPVTVQCADLTMTKGNNVTNSAVVGQAWTWTLTVTNGGNANAVFTNGQTILTDNLPNSNVTYGSPSSNNANVSCSIASSNLTCTAAVAGVTLTPAASFTVTFTATGTAPATNVNPRAAGIARIDSGTLIVESNEGNNDATSNTVTVGKASTTLTSLTDSPDPSVTGQSYTAGFTLNVTAPGAGTPTGTVTVADGTGGSCIATLPATSCALTSTTAGAKTLTFTYSGDGNFLTSNNTTGHLVNKADTTASITADTPDPSNVGQNVTVTYSVAVTSPGAGTPTGNVVVSDGVTICTATVAAGQCTGPMNTAGSRNITATYQGDTNFNASPASANAPHVVGTVTWTGASSTAFATNGNWDTGLAPGSGDTAIIPTGATNQPTISGATSLTSLSVASGRTLTVNSTLTVSGTLTNNGTINGNGTIINNFSNAGSLAPGLSPGILNITGTYANPGILAIEIGGTGGAGVNPTGHDQLLVSGAATMGGTLNVTLTNGFTPAPGNSFVILDAATSTGTFAITNLPNIAPLTWNVAYNNANGTVTLTVMGPTAANVGVSGRVLTSEGRGVSKARVTLTDSGGNIVYAMTSSFGYYRFVNVAAGQTYVIAVTSKQYQFTPRVIQVSDELTGIDFIADPET